MGVSLASTVIRLLANNAARLSSLKVGAGHARVDIGELLDRDAPARGHTLAGLAALCLDVKVALYTMSGDEDPPVGRDKAQARAGEEAEQNEAETCRVHVCPTEGLLSLVQMGKRVNGAEREPGLGDEPDVLQDSGKSQSDMAARRPSILYADTRALLRVLGAKLFTAANQSVQLQILTLIIYMVRKPKDCHLGNRDLRESKTEFGSYIALTA